MAPPKKGVKMDLGDFLQNDEFDGGWDAEVDFSNIGVPAKPSASTPLSAPISGSAPLPAPSGRSRLDPALQGNTRGAREEYPIPEVAPFRVRVSNLPWDADEEAIGMWIEDGTSIVGAVDDVVAPREREDQNKLRGFAFVTLTSRDNLIAALKLNATQLNGRNVYVAVAAPEREERRGGFRGGDDNLDWGSARGSGFQERAPRREEPDLDWGSARGSGFQPRPERRERREEPDLDWGSARGSGFQPKPERRERREEPDLDWGSARGAAFQPKQERKPRREEPELDWGSARGAAAPSRANRQRKDEPELDWGSARSAKPAAAKKEAPAAPAEKKEKAKSSFGVLATHGDDDEEEEIVQAPVKKQEELTALERATANMTVDDSDDWEVVKR